MTRIFERFDHAFRNLDKELSHGRLEILPELWVHARMMMGSCTPCAPMRTRALSLSLMMMGSGTRLGSLCHAPLHPTDRLHGQTSFEAFFSCFPYSCAPFSCPSLCRTLATSTEPCFRWAGEALAIRTEEPRDRVTKPKASFFRAKSRKLHIMKGLLPRAAKF